MEGGNRLHSHGSVKVKSRLSGRGPLEGRVGEWLKSRKIKSKGSRQST